MLIAEWLYQAHSLLYQTSWVNQFEEFTWNGKILEDFLKTVQNPVWELSFFVSTNFNLRFFVSSNCALTSFVLTFYSCKSCCKWRPQLTLVSILYFALIPSYFLATISCIVCFVDIIKFTDLYRLRWWYEGDHYRKQCKVWRVPLHWCIVNQTWMLFKNHLAPHL